MMEKPRVLVVDDDPQVRELLSILLARRAHVTLAADGQEALELVGRAIPNVIVCDYEMPHMRAPELISCFRESAATRNTPVILISGHSDAIMMEGGIANVRFLAKPFLVSEFMQAIDAALTPPSQQ